VAIEGVAWVDPNVAGWIRRPASEAAWEELVADYGGDPQYAGPFRRIVDIVRENGCRSVVVENRYVDADYRSEFSAFWASRFADRSPFARRLHFFTAEVDEADLHALPRRVIDAYLGYAVCRPVELGAVGRTVIRWPASMDGSVITHVDDVVTLFGNALIVQGAPFCQQDTEFLRCAHAAAWMCHYTAHRRGFVGRHLTAAFAAAAPSLLSQYRKLPSKGLTPLQVQAIFDALGQPAVALDINNLPRVQGVSNPTPLSDPEGKRRPGGLWDTRIVSIICRYLNSGFPVFVGTSNHAFTVVGWRREGGDVHFIVNDDARGPYLRVESPLEDEPRRPWQLMMVPMPPKVYLGAEGAENHGYTTLSVLGAAAGATQALTELAVGLQNDKVKLRTLLLDGSDYKRRLIDRGLDADAVKLLRLARLPHYVWVVEAHDVDRCAANQPCVIAEVIFDSTSHEERPRKDALVGPGFAISFPPNSDPDAVPTNTDAWRSNLGLLGPGH
jgi:hypothetical protein